MAPLKKTLDMFDDACRRGSPLYLPQLAPRMPANLRLGYLAVMQKKADEFYNSAAGRLFLARQHAKDNLPGVLRRIDDLEAKVKRLSKAPSSADRLTPEMAAASPAQFESLWKKVKQTIASQEALGQHVTALAEWAQEQIGVLDNSITTVDQHFVKIKDNDKFKSDIQTQLKSFLKKVQQQKVDTNKDTTEFKNHITGELASLKAMADKSKDVAQVSPKNDEVQRLREKSEEHGEYISNLGKQIRLLQEQNEAQARLIAQQGAELAGNRKEISHLKAAKADMEAGQKVQDDRLSKIEQFLGVQAGFPHNGQQSPGPGPDQQQQPQPQPGPSSQAPGPQGNGLWTPSPSPPGQGSQPAGDVDMEEFDDLELDSPMTDAPEEPRLPQHPEPHQSQPLHPQFHQPLSYQPLSYQPQSAQQPPQPITAAPADTPMGNDGPVVASNNGNGAIAPPTAPPADPSIFNPGALNSNPNSFAFNGTPPAVNKPQINWSAKMETLSFDPPPELADDDEGPSRSTAKMPPATAAPIPPPTSQPAPTHAASFYPAAGHPAPLHAAPFSHPTGQPNADMRPPTNNGAFNATNINGGSASNAPPPPVANNGPSSSPAAGQLSSADKPTPKAKPAQKKKPSLFMPRKPAATPSKPAPVTSKAQTTQTAAASWAQKKQEAFRAGQMPPAAQTPSPAPKAPMATMTPADDESAEWIKEMEGKPNPSPFATKPKPASKPSTPPYGSSTSSTHDTVESADPGNMFLKDIIEEPKPEPQPQPQPKTPPTHVHEPEVNPRKHTGTYRSPTVEDEDDATMGNGRKTLRPKGCAHKIPADKADEIIEDQLVEQAFNMWDVAMAASKAAAEASKSPSPDAEARTSKMTGGQVPEPRGAPDQQDVSDDALDREHAQKVVRVTRPDEPRLTAKPKSRLSKMTPDQLQGHKEVQARIDAEEAEERKKVQEAARKLAEALASQDDEVDYGDPQDENDEDTHITVMMPPTKSTKPTKYSLPYFLNWEQHIRGATRNFAKFTFGAGDDITQQWRETLDHFDTQVCPLNKLIPWAGYDYEGVEGYTRLQMENIMSFWVQEVFVAALCKVGEDLKQDADLDESKQHMIHTNILAHGKKHLSRHAPDVV